MLLPEFQATASSKTSISIQHQVLGMGIYDCGNRIYNFQQQNLLILLNEDINYLKYVYRGIRYNFAYQQSGTLVLTMEESNREDRDTKYIKELQNQNIELKQKYDTLFAEFERFKSAIRDKINNGQIQSKLFADLNLKSTQISTPDDWDIDGFWSTNKNTNNTENSEKMTEQKSTDSPHTKNARLSLIDFCESEMVLKEEMESPRLNPDDIDNFAVIMNEMRKTNSSKKSMAEKYFPLIQGCFIIQKKNVQLSNKKINALLEMTEFAYPQDLLKTDKQTLEMVIRYIFGSDLEPTKIMDDDYDSRKNQIIYGTPYDDYSFAFEDHKWNNKKEIPEILKQMGTLKKKYVYVLVRPELIELEDPIEVSLMKQEKENGEEEGEEDKGENDEKEQGKSYRNKQAYQTDIIYGFISPFPLRSFFQDLHRTIQQQVKYTQFSQNQEGSKAVSPAQKFTIIGDIMKKIVDKSYKIKQFPIQQTYETGIGKLELDIPTLEHFNSIENQYLKQSLQKYNFVKVIKLLHYVLAERFVLIEAKQKKNLNQIMEMIRLMIKPFFWIFAVVYTYSEYFEPFLSSPMPIIIGKSANTGNFSEDIDLSDFNSVYMDGQQPDLKQGQRFYRSIRRLKKQADKSKDSRQKLIHRYIKNLKSFIEKGGLDQQPTDFHIEFIETQMVSYYKDLLESNQS